MDTFWTADFSKCVKCSRCVTACKKEGIGCLYGMRDQIPDIKRDFAPCHICTDRFKNPAPCKEVCHYDAIVITRE